MYDIAIIGAGPAGMTAGLYAVRAGLRAVVLERLFAGGQVATTSVVENYPGFPGGIDGLELAAKFEEHARGFGLEVRSEEVKSLRLAGSQKEIETSAGMVSASAVILCMGAKPRPLGAPGEERFRGSGVSYCATCDGALFQGRRVAVVGGGDTAAQDAMYLSQMCAEVLLIHRRDTLRAAVTIASRALGRPNVRPVWNARVLEIIGDKRVSGIRLDVSGEERVEDIDGIFIAVGTEPVTSLVKDQVALDEQGYILAGEDTRTSLPLVYAAGDVRQKPLRQIVTAAADGANAVYSALADIAGA